MQNIIVGGNSLLGDYLININKRQRNPKGQSRIEILAHWPYMISIINEPNIF